MNQLHLAMNWSRFGALILRAIVLLTFLLQVLGVPTDHQGEDAQNLGSSHVDKRSRFMDG